MDEIILKIAEVPQRYVGNGISIVDPKTIKITQDNFQKALEKVESSHETRTV